MKLLIDIGNTSAKLAISNEGEIVHFERRNEAWIDVFFRLNREYSIDKIAISSVAGPDAELDEALEQIAIPFVRIAWNTPCPVKELKGIPEGYGADRIAADFAAVAMDPVHPILVIDAGTCITYDLFSAEGEILGGVISPGVQLRLKAMHDHTALLPLIKAESDAPLFAMDTKGCLLAGAVRGAQFEVIGYIREVMREIPDIHVFLTGGNDFEIPDDFVGQVTKDSCLVLKGLDLL